MSNTDPVIGQAHDAQGEVAWLVVGPQMGLVNTVDEQEMDYNW